VLFYHSGNRDDTVFEDPWRFDITRDPNRHLGFGGGGPHYCLGASLARSQLRSIFSELLRVMPDIEVDEPELFASSSFIHGVKRMDCTFKARA
jgi:cytochrome P450